MARLFNDATPDYLRNTNTPPVTAAPFTFAAWARSDDATAGQVVMGIGDKDVALHFWELAFAGNVAGDPIRFSADAGGVAANADTSSGFTANTWHHVAAKEIASNSRAVFIDGGSKGTNTTSRSPSSVDELTIGVRANSTVTANPFSGDIAECAIWNVALADADIALLAKGVWPPLVVPQSLIYYNPLLGRYSPEIDLRNGFNMTLNGTPAASAHPRIYYPPHDQIRKYTSPVVTTAVRDIIGSGIIPFAR